MLQSFCLVHFMEKNNFEGERWTLKKGRLMKFFSSVLTFVMILSLLSPLAVSANNDRIAPFKEGMPNESTMQLKSAVAEQLEVLNGQPVLHKDLQGLSGDEEVAVIIHLSEKPIALEMGIKKLAGKQLSSTEEQKIKSTIKAQQTFLKKEMNIKKIAYKQGFSYDTVLNGFSATVQAKDLDALVGLTGVTLVEPDVTVYTSEKVKELPKKPIDKDFDKVIGGDKTDELQPAMNTSISFLGIEKLWNEGIEGQGIKVAVLDTGIDADHPDFEGIYKGGKNFVPHTGNDYARQRADDDASETSPADRPAHRPEVNANGSTFYTSHGTHVAGTIAAIGNNEFGVKGIAPKVDLYAYRVLGAYGSGATSGIIAAIEESVNQEMDIINLSLGGGGNSETDGASFAINNAMMAGTIGVIATGNSGPNRGTMGTPATSRLGIAVGNTTNPETMYNAEVNVSANDLDFSKRVNLMATTFGENLAAQLKGEYEIVAVPGIGAEKDFKDIDVKGKVALISRGEIAFVDKIENAKANGAVATIIHNFAGGTNAPGISDVFLGDAFEFIPSFDLSQTDGDAIRTALGNGGGTVTFGNVKSETTVGDEVNDSSSRGPSTPNFDIKPDVSAPGTNIMSTLPMYKADFPEASYEEAFGRKTGTSMATPHIAGVAALVKQANPEWDAFDVKVALSNTAKILNQDKYDVFAQGAGRVQPYEAARTDVLAYAIDTANNNGEEVENLKGTVTFGPQSLESDLSVTKQMVVKDLKKTGQNFDISVDVTKSFGDAKLTVEKEGAVSSNGEQLVNLTLTASKATAKAGDELLGYIHIQGGDTNLSLPFAADFGGEAAVEIKDMSITETDLSFDGDGVQDEATLAFTITGDVTTNYIEIWDILDPEGGVYEDGYIGYLHAGNMLGAGSYTLKVDGEYKPWDPAEPVQKIPDGLYTIDFTALTASGNPPIISDYVGPIIVKSTKPEIEGTVENGQATGQIIDKYLDYNEELTKYGLQYDINDKLHASYQLTKNGETANAVPFNLNPDGSFAISADFTGATAMTILVKDAAGNQAEQIIFEGEESTVDYALNKEQLELEVGETTQLILTETTTNADGTTEEKDITADAQFNSANSDTVTVENGQVTALGAGQTEITVSYEDFTAKIPVTVTAPAVDESIVTYSVNKKELKLGVGQQEQLIVTEKTVAPDGTTTYKDVTDLGKYNVVNNQIATVHKGLVSAHQPGKTQVRVMIPGQETILVYLEVEQVPQDIVSYKVNKKDLTLGVGQQEQLIVTEITEKVDGSTVEKDVTPQTKFNVVNNTIAKVNKGLVTAHQPGKTQVRVMIPGEDTIFVYLEVKEIPQDIVTYELSETNVQMAVAEQKQLTVTEKTTKPNGQIIEKDVTIATKFKVVNNKIAKVNRGLLTAFEPGKTQVVVTIPNEESTLVYLEVTKAEEEEAPSNQFVITKEAISADLNDKKTKELVLEIPTKELETAVEFSGEVLQMIANAKKDVVLKYEDATFSFKKNDVKKLWEAAKNDVTITLEKSIPQAVKEAISDTFSIEIEKGFGEQKQQLQSFKANMDIVLPIDASKLKNEKKVAVYEPSAKKALKANYKKGVLSFSAKETGSFTVVNE